MLKRIISVFLLLFVTSSFTYAVDNYFYIPYTQENVRDLYLTQKGEDNSPQFLLDFYSSYYPLFVDTKNLQHLNLDMIFKSYNGIENKFLNQLVGYDKESNVYLGLYDINVPTPIYLEKDWEIIQQNNNISLYDLLNQKFFILKDKMLTEYWNENLSTIKNYLWKNDKEACQPLKDITVSFSDITNLKLNNFYLRISKEEMSRYYACLFADNIYTVNSNNLNTQYLDYRYKNIKIGLDNIHNAIIQPNEDYSVAYNLFVNPNSKKNYVDGDALIYNPKTKKIEAKKTGGGGLCGISTIVYQTILQDGKNLDIKIRYPHSQYYRSLYGNNIGLDATIYGWNYKENKAYKDLIFTNNWKSAVLMQVYLSKAYKGRFDYGLNMYSLDYKGNETKPSFNKLNKKSNCYYTIVSDSKTNKELTKYRSCYELAQ